MIVQGKNLVGSANAVRRVIRVGQFPDRVHVTGCPSIDVAKQTSRSRMATNDTFEAYGGVGLGPRLDISNGYFVVAQLPVTSEYLAARSQIGETLAAVAASGVPALPAASIGTRQSGKDRGRNVMDVDCRRHRILDAIPVCKSIGRFDGDDLHGDGNAGGRLADVPAAAPLETVKTLAY